MVYIWFGVNEYFCTNDIICILESFIIPSLSVLNIEPVNTGDSTLSFKVKSWHFTNLWHTMWVQSPYHFVLSEFHAEKEKKIYNSLLCFWQKGILTDTVTYNSYWCLEPFMLRKISKHLTKAKRTVTFSKEHVTL